MVVLKLCKIGDSLGVVLPEDVVKRLGAGDSGELLLLEAPDGYHLTSPQEAQRRKLEKAEEIMRRYRNTLRELAK